MTTAMDRVPPDLVTDFDVYEPSLATPVDVFQQRVAELAAKGPVVYSPAYGGHWIVTRYKEIQQVLTDPSTFSSYPNNLVTPADFGKFIPLELDPPEHTAYRHVLQPLFSPQRMKKLSDDIRTVVNGLIDEFAPKGQAEFISEFAHELPARVFLALMDWPLEDAALFAEADGASVAPGGACLVTGTHAGTTSLFSTTGFRARMPALPSFSGASAMNARNSADPCGIMSG